MDVTIPALDARLKAREAQLEGFATIMAMRRSYKVVRRDKDLVVTPCYPVGDAPSGSVPMAIATPKPCPSMSLSYCW